MRKILAALLAIALVNPPAALAESWHRTATHADTRELVKIANVSWRIVETGELWRVAYKFDVQNAIPYKQNLQFVVHFMDRDGFRMDTDMDRPLIFAARQSRTITGSCLITGENARNLSGLHIEIAAY